MRITEYKFSENEIIRLREYRDNQSDYRLKIRFMAMLMIASDNKPEYIASVIGKCAKTVENWFKIYVSEGIDRLNTFDYKPKQTYLTINEIHQAVIFATYENPSAFKQVREYIEQKFGVSYDVETVRQMLKKYNVKIIHPKTVPGNPPTAEEQQKFINDINVLKASGAKILYGDAMHLIHQTVPSRCLGNPCYPPVLETDSSRKRLNVLGAYDPDTYSLIHLTGEENCNAEKVIEFFNKILNRYPHESKICVTLDNAKYFHARIVTEWCDSHPNFNRLFLPPYAPNLNLIERLWRFTKKELVRNKYYKEYKKFRAKAFQFLNNIGEHTDKLKTLMVEKFEIVYA